MHSLLVMFLAVSSVGALRFKPATEADSEAAGAGDFGKVDWGNHFRKSKEFESTAVHHKGDPDIANLLDAVVTIPSNPYYRVSDVMCNKGHGVGTCIQHVLEDADYQGTILNTYLQRRNKQEKGIELLRKIIDEGNWSVSKAQSTDIVVHVRAGDRVPGLTGHLGDPLLAVRNLMQNDACKNAKRIVVVTAKSFQTCAPGEPCEDTHEQKQYGMTDKVVQENDVVFTKMFEQLSTLGLDVAVQSHMNIDQDIAFMAAAKCLARTTGGFSTGIMAPLVEMTGGVVEPKPSHGSWQKKNCKW